MRPYLLALMILLAALAAPSASATQNDAATGGDAANDAASATPVQGAFAGFLDSDAGDVADWFLLPSEAGRGLELTIATDIDVFGGVDVRVVEGSSTIAWGSVSSWFPRTISFATQGDAVAVGLLHDDFWGEPTVGNYTVTFRTFPLPDASVEIVDVRMVEIGTDAGSVPAGVLREVELLVANAGEGQSDAYLRVVARPETSGDERVLFDGTIEIAPGTERTLVVEWDALGQIGDIEIVASIFQALDVDPTNNEDARNAYALVSGTGQGVDLFTQRRAVGDYNEGATLGTGYGAAGPSGYAEAVAWPYAGASIVASASGASACLVGPAFGRCL